MSDPPPVPERESTPNDHWSVERTWHDLITGQLPLERETSAFILVNVIDFFMTYLMISVDPNVVEGNPVAAYFLYRWGPFKGMLIFKLSLVTFVCIITQIVALKNVRLARWVLNFGSVVVTGVILYSLMLYLRNS